jgi:hypothetical protein
MGSRSRTSSSFPERTVWLIIVLALVAALVVLVVQRRSPDRPHEPTVHGELAPVRPGAPARIDPETAVPDATAPPQRLPTLSEHHLRRFRAKGLENPATDLIRDLRQRPELVPHEAVLGGRMYFVESESYVLSDRWVLATFEDGHIRGRMLLEYRLSNHGEITWRVLDSYLE